MFNKYGYPQLAFSAVTDRAPELAKRWPNSFWFLGTSAQYVDSLAQLLKKLRDEGKINANVAMISVADGFGIDLSGAARKGFADAGFKLSYDKSYPVGTQDLAPIIADAKASGADTFVAFSYPPDTMALTEQSKVASFAPKVMFLGVGVGFPLYPQRFGADTEGIISLGGWSRDNASTQAYAKKHQEMFNRGPDRWGSQVGYASLQMLEQAVERVGKIDREAIVKELQTGTFDTVIGKIKLENNMPKDAFWHIGQWQDGFFVGIAPQRVRACHRRDAEAGLQAVAVFGKGGGSRAAVSSRGWLETATEPGRAGCGGPATRSMLIEVVLTGLTLGGMYALTAMGLTLQYGVARIMNLSYGELLIAAAFAALWFYHGAGRQPTPRPGRRPADCLCRELRGLPPPAAAAGPTGEDPRRARGRQHPRHLRPAVRHPGRPAGDLRRRLLQLFLPRRSREVLGATVAANRLLALPMGVRHRARPLPRPDADPDTAPPSGRSRSIR